MIPNIEDKIVITLNRIFWVILNMITELKNIIRTYNHTKSMNSNCKFKFKSSSNVRFE
jgi:phosphoenolpyruvate carboxylase